MSVTELNYSSSYAAIEDNSYATNGIWLQMKTRTWWLRTRMASGNAGVWVVRTAGNAGDDSYSVTNTLAPIIRLG